MNKHQEQIVSMVGSRFSPPQFILGNTSSSLIESIPAYDLYFAKNPEGLVRTTGNRICTVEYLQFMLRSWSMKNMPALNWALWTDDLENAEKDVLLSIMSSSGDSVMTRKQTVTRIERNGGLIIIPDPEPFTVFHDVIIPGITPGKSWHVYYTSMPIDNRLKRA